MNRLHNRRQNEATEYGSAFARAMEVVIGDSRLVFVSGTASIDDHGATVHVGDFETQTRYTLEAVAALLDGAGARLLDDRAGHRLREEPVRRARVRAHRRALAARVGAARDDRRGRLPRRPAVRDRRHGRASRARGAPVSGGRTAAVALVLAAAGAAVCFAAVPPAPRVTGDEVAHCRRGARRRRTDRRRAGPRRCARRRGARRRLAARAGLGEGGRLVARVRGRRAARAHGRLRERRRPRGLVRRQVDPVRGKEGRGRPVVRLGDEGRRHRRAAGHLRRGWRAPARLPVDDLHDHARRASSHGCRSRSWARTRARGTRRASPRTRACGPARRDGTALRRLTYNLSNDVDPVDPARRPHGVRGLASLVGEGRAERPRAAPRRERGRHRLPDVRGGRGPAREADACADREGPRRVRRGRGDRRRRLRPARRGRAAAPAAHLPLAHGRGRRLLPRAVAPAGRPRARRLARRRARGASRIYRFDPATGAREKAFEDRALALGGGEARRAPAGARTRARASCARTTS